jgi:hypothetical protein
MSGEVKPAKPVEVVASAEPIVLGSMLFTVVEPHKGHEVDYNRWYERDHFYSGVMIGPYTFAGRRFVSTKDLKKLQKYDPEIFQGEPGAGSYVAVYWVLDGYHELWNKWSVRQVIQLHAKNRMFEHRDHVHTLLYRFHWALGRDADGVPIELALDHNYEGFVPVWVDANDGTTREEVWEYLQGEFLPELLAGTSASLVGAFTPLPLQVDAPGVAKQDENTTRTLLLFFLDQEPTAEWNELFEEGLAKFDESGKATAIAAAAFKPTHPGTDDFTDELWD